jgi:hypothetical protein
MGMYHMYQEDTPVLVAVVVQVIASAPRRKGVIANGTRMFGKADTDDIIGVPPIAPDAITGTYHVPTALEVTAVETAMLFVTVAVRVPGLVGDPLAGFTRSRAPTGVLQRVAYESRPKRAARMCVLML